jgi:F420-non-reducing hydrogenase small subunit
MIDFAVLQLSGCAGCEVSLLNAGGWLEEHRLVYMPLVVSAADVPAVDILLVSGGLRTEEDAFNLRRVARRASKVVAVGTCALSGGIASLGDRDEVRELFITEEGRRHVPRLLPRCHPIDVVAEVDLYVPGCPPTPELFMAALSGPETFEASRVLCQECGRKKLKDMRPTRLAGFQAGEVLPDVCLVNQGYLCLGTSVRGGCRAPCPRAGHPCVGCRGPSDSLISQDAVAWLRKIRRVFKGMTDVSDDELNTGLTSPHLALFLFQFSDYAMRDRTPRPIEKVL